MFYFIYGTYIDMYIMMWATYYKGSNFNILMETEIFMWEGEVYQPYPLVYSII